MTTVAVQRMPIAQICGLWSLCSISYHIITMVQSRILDNTLVHQDRTLQLFYIRFCLTQTFWGLYRDVTISSGNFPSGTPAVSKAYWLKTSMPNKQEVMDHVHHSMPTIDLLYFWASPKPELSLLPPSTSLSSRVLCQTSPPPHSIKSLMSICILEKCRKLEDMEGSEAKMPVAASNLSCAHLLIMIGTGWCTEIYWPGRWWLVGSKSIWCAQVLWLL